tara:strand:- start:725 stop:973 length:249 start_codon:yes stop_codon:yes gene_type:complete
MDQRLKVMLNNQMNVLQDLYLTKDRLKQLDEEVGELCKKQETQIHSMVAFINEEIEKKYQEQNLHTIIVEGDNHNKYVGSLL